MPVLLDVRVLLASLKVKQHPQDQLCRSEDALTGIASLLLELLLLPLAELPLETRVLLGGLGHATHLVNAAQQEAALSAITIKRRDIIEWPFRLSPFLSGCGS